MKIELTIREPHLEPEKFSFSGNYAFETMINKLVTKYYGLKIADKITNLFKERVKKDGEE